MFNMNGEKTISVRLSKGMQEKLAAIVPSRDAYPYLWKTSYTASDVIRWLIQDWHRREELAAQEAARKEAEKPKAKDNRRAVSSTRPKGTKRKTQDRCVTETLSDLGD